jgi:hypothetical protein
MKEASPIWHEAAMGFESGMIERRTSWRGYQKVGRSDKTVCRTELGIGAVETTYEELLDMPFGWLRAEGTG